MSKVIEAKVLTKAIEICLILKIMTPRILFLLLTHNYFIQYNI